MPRLEPDTRLRLSPVELGSIELAGGASTATLGFASDGSTVEWAGGDITLVACPDLVTVTWELHGVKVSAQLDVVSSSYCSVESIKGYRADVYQLSDQTDDAVIEARSRAIEIIEREAGRFLQPVVRVGVVDRPNCSRVSIPLVDGRMATDVCECMRAEAQDGTPVRVKVETSVSLYVGDVRVGEFAKVVLNMGLRTVPAEMRDAVRVLAAYLLAPKAAPENASSMSTEAGVINYVTAGIGGAATSLPDVNAVIARYGLKRPLVG